MYYHQTFPGKLSRYNTVRRVLKFASFKIHSWIPAYFYSNFCFFGWLFHYLITKLRCQIKIIAGYDDNLKIKANLKTVLVLFSQKILIQMLNFLPQYTLSAIWAHFVDTKTTDFTARSLQNEQYLKLLWWWTLQAHILLLFKARQKDIQDLKMLVEKRKKTTCLKRTDTIKFFHFLLSWLGIVIYGPVSNWLFMETLVFLELCEWAVYYTRDIGEFVEVWLYEELESIGHSREGESPHKQNK